jgi:hypothetical protein
MNTGKAASELQQQKLNLILKDYTSRTVSNILPMIEFVKENY